MDPIELIRNADSTAEVFSALALYVGSLRPGAAIPQWCRRLPIQGEADIVRRMAGMFIAADIASRNLLHRECRVAKRALHVFAAAATRLRRAG